MTNRKLLMAISVSAILLGGCFDSETGASQRAANGATEEAHAPAKHEAKEAPAKAEETAPVAEEAPAKVEEAAPATEETPEKAEEVAPVVEEAPAKVEEVAPVVEEASAKVEEATPATEEAPTEAEETAAAPAVATPNLGACNGCHGANFEKKAMGVSKVVSGMSKADIVTAIKGYKDGTYGGAMKGLMKGQVASFDDASINAIAEAIGK